VDPKKGKRGKNAGDTKVCKRVSEYERQISKIRKESKEGI
jgi:hypothetical protein